MIKFLELNRDKKELKNIRSKINAFISRGKYILSDNVKLFENKISKFTDSKYAIGVGSGTDAIYMIIKALNLKKVAVCASAPLPCAQAIVMAGAKPIFIDSEQYSGLINLDDLKKKINKIDSILAVHLYGQTERIIEISNIIKGKNIKLIEDCSQSIDTYINKIHTGNLGIACALSFYPTKNLGAYGDGGMIITNNKKLANIFYKMRNYGQGKQYAAEIFGINSRLDEIQALILIEKLKTLKKKNKIRKKIAFMYEKNIKNNKIILPNMHYFNTSNFHIFPIFSKKRNALKKYLLENEIQTAIHYPIPLHNQKFFKNNIVLKNAEEISKTELSLPIYPELTKREIDYIINIINRF